MFEERPFCTTDRLGRVAPKIRIHLPLGDSERVPRSRILLLSQTFESAPDLPLELNISEAEV